MGYIERPGSPETIRNFARKVFWDELIWFQPRAGHNGGDWPGEIKMWTPVGTSEYSGKPRTFGYNSWQSLRSGWPVDVAWYISNDLCWTTIWNNRLKRKYKSLDIFAFTTISSLRTGRFYGMYHNYNSIPGDGWIDPFQHSSIWVVGVLMRNLYPPAKQQPAKPGFKQYTWTRQKPAERWNCLIITVSGQVGEPFNAALLQVPGEDWIYNRCSLHAAE